MPDAPQSPRIPVHHDLGLSLQYFGPLAAILALSLQIKNFNALANRRLIYGLLAIGLLALLVTSFRKVRGPTMISDPVPDPKAVGRRRPQLIWLALILFIWAADEVYYRTLSPVSLLIVQYLGNAVRPDAVPAEPVDSSGARQFSNCVEWVRVPPEDRDAFLADRRRRVMAANNQDYAAPIDGISSDVLYAQPVGVAVEFWIQKNPNFRQVTLVDVEVIVEDYCSLPPTPAAAAGAELIDVIWVEIAKGDCKKLPWRYGAKFLLSDPNRKVATRWESVQYEIAGDIQRLLLVKLSAKDRGIYTYRIDLLVRDSESSRVSRVPLVSAPQTTAFFGSGDDDPIEVPIEPRYPAPTADPPEPSSSGLPFHGGRGLRLDPDAVRRFVTPDDAPAPAPPTAPGPD